MISYDLKLNEIGAVAHSSKYCTIPSPALVDDLELAAFDLEVYDIILERYTGITEKLSAEPLNELIQGTYLAPGTKYLAGSPYNFA